MNKYSILRPIEQSIVFFFVWREISGINGWYEKGIKALAKQINRNEKSVREAIDTLEEMSFLTTQRNQNVIWIKHTLSNEELYSRMAFIDYMLSQSQPFQELKKDLEQEIARLEEEIELAKEEVVRKEEQNKLREKVIQQITSEDIEILVDRLLAERSFENANMTNEDKIRNEIEKFREEMFSKYGGEKNTDDIIYYM
ncbi:MAG TPA: hypothetical protein VMX55_09910 [candidate division Zixibacteria bacterium]|nr:hypothetical protein [candidate division Zixibacteria bacterium]